MKTIRFHLAGFTALLFLSGITAFPVVTEIDFLFRNKTSFPDFLTEWIELLYAIIHNTPDIMFYGTDWLAFAHMVIGLFFIPVYMNPVKHKANIIVAMVACLLVFPLAFICGSVRGIPFFHQLIDCSFGLIGMIYLSYILHKINRLNLR